MPRVAVLKGGRSLERQVSLRSGARVEEALERLGHGVEPIDVGGDLVDRLTAAEPDIAFVALHGRDGEDGTIQELLEVMGIPYTGSGVSACIRAADKVLAKHAMRDQGIPTPDFYAFNETAFREPGAAQALPAIEERLQFPIVEAVPVAQGEDDFYDFESRYEIGRTKFVCPADLADPVAERAHDLAVAVYELMGCSGFARVDLMLESATDELYVLETNPIPGLTETSLLPQAADAAGIGFDELIGLIVEAAAPVRA